MAATKQERRTRRKTREAQKRMRNQQKREDKARRVREEVFDALAAYDAPDRRPSGNYVVRATGLDWPTVRMKLGELHRAQRIKPASTWSQIRHQIKDWDRWSTA